MTMSTDHRGLTAGSRVDRREFLKTAGAGSLAAAAFLTNARRSAAQGSSQYPDWVPPSPKPPKRGGVMTRASAWDPPVLDPRLTNSVGLFQIASLTSSRLVRFPFSDEATGTSDLTLKGDLAESWQGNSDFRVWTFKLRQGVKWQNVAPLNGREFVAADVKYCFEQYAKEGVQSFTFQEIEGIETPDKHTVRIHLKMPNTMFPQNLAEPVAVLFSPRGAGGGRRSQEAHDRHRPLHPEGAHAEGARACWRGTPTTSTRAGRTSTSTTCSRRRTRPRGRRPSAPGRATCIFLASVSDADTVHKTNPAAVIEEFKGMQTPFGLALAQDRPPFNDVRVRRAISMAIDRQKQVDTVFEGHGILGWGIPYIYYQDKPPTAAQLGPYWQYKPAEAKKLLAEAGHPNGFETTLFYYEYFPQMSSQVQLVQQDLKKNLNINVKITKLDYTTFYGRYAEGKWDGMAWGFKTGYAVGLDEQTYQYMHSKSTKNYFRFADPVIDELVDQAPPDAGPRRAEGAHQEDRRPRARPGAPDVDAVRRGFLIWQPHLRNMGALAMRRTDGYGASTLARVWADK